jgi:hypothetical protein
MMTELELSVYNCKGLKFLIVGLKFLDNMA